MVWSYIWKTNNIPSLKEYVEGHYPQGRAGSIMAAVNNSIDRNHIDEYYTCMFKRGESFNAGDAKERNIMSPHLAVVGFHGWLNHVLLQAVESHPAFAFHAKSRAEIETRLSEQMGPEDTFVSIDGSRHDAHQHQVLMGAESRFYAWALSRLFRYSGLPATIYRAFDASVRNTIFKVKLPGVYFDRIYRWKTATGYCDTIKVRGTTFSGNPLRTTLGNSLRVYAYMQYYSLHAGVKTKCLVAGDDSIMIVKYRDVIPLIRATVQLSYREVPLEPTQPVGLGQVYKKFYWGDTGSFLSHYVFKFPNLVNMVRLPGSFIRAGQWAIGEPAQTAAGVAFLHACDGAHVRPYAAYSAAYVKEVKKHKWEDTPLTSKMLQVLFYHFYSRDEVAEFTTDYAVMHEMDWRGWDWRILENLVYFRHAPVPVVGNE